MKTRKVTSSNTALIMALVVAVLAMGAYVLVSNRPAKTLPAPKEETILTTDDLNKASQELDSVNVDDIDTQTNQITSDVSSL